MIEFYIIIYILALVLAFAMWINIGRGLKFLKARKEADLRDKAERLRAALARLGVHDTDV